jgi:hypothetical protein
MHGPPDDPKSEGAATRQSGSPQRQAEFSPPLDSSVTPAVQAPPDLQSLVLAHGHWGNIPPEAWREHDAKVAAYRASIRDGARWVQPARGGNQTINPTIRTTGAPVGDMLRGE